MTLAFSVCIIVITIICGVKICRRVYSLSSESVLLQVPTCKMHKLNLLGICKMAIECIEEDSSGGLTTRSSV
jgi:hypothetical protein